MYKKLLFLAITMPLIHSTIYSMDTFRTAQRDATRSFAKTATYGTALATVLFLSKGNTEAKEAALPLLTTIMITSGINAITSFITSGSSAIAEKKSWAKLSDFLSKANSVSVIIGFVAGFGFYHDKGSMFK